MKNIGLVVCLCVAFSSFCTFSEEIGQKYIYQSLRGATLTITKNGEQCRVYASESDVVDLSLCQGGDSLLMYSHFLHVNIKFANSFPEFSVTDKTIWNANLVRYFPEYKVLDRVFKQVALIEIDVKEGKYRRGRKYRVLYSKMDGVIFVSQLTSTWVTSWFLKSQRGFGAE